MTLVANPQKTSPAIPAHLSFAAVITSRVPVMGNASANVSATGVPFRAVDSISAAWGISRVLFNKILAADAYPRAMRISIRSFFLLHTLSCGNSSKQRRVSS